MESNRVIREYKYDTPVSYLPDFLCQLYSQAQNQKLPYSIDLEAGLLFIDVCSFTKLTETVTAKGHYGVETITRILNSYFKLVQQQIRLNGGEIVKFAGDSVLALFFGDEASTLSAISSCADGIKKNLITLNKKFISGFDISLAFHGIACWGKSKLLIIGNPDYHLDYLLYGNGMRKLFNTDFLTLQNEIQYITRMNKIANQGIVKHTIHLKSNHYDFSIFLPPALREVYPQKRFSAELRNVAVLFIRLDVRHLGAKNYANNLNSAYQHIQDKVYRYEGIVSKVDFNEKGLVIICSFGYPIIHLNDVQRAVFSARDIISYKHPGIFRIGITYSNIYTGILGDSKRFEYGIIGSAVNAAARLMMEANQDEILVTNQILQHVEVRFTTEYVKNVKVKGFDNEVEIHRIVSELPISFHSLSKLYASQELVAWHTEIETIHKSFCNNTSAKVFISGEPGTGKSFVLWHLISLFHQSQKNIVLLSLEEFNQSSPFFFIEFLLKECWDINNAFDNVQDLFNILSSRTTGLNVELIANYFKGINRDHLTDFDRGIYLDVVLDQLSLLLKHLCSNFDILIIDNLHWADMMSLKILQAFANSDDTPCKVILTSRFGIYQDQFQSMDYYLELQNLSPELALQLVNHHFPSISSEAASHIFNLSHGNPLFINELCLQIRFHHQEEHWLITLADIHNLERIGALPQTIENLFIQRLKYFSPEIQYLLKLAAIVGKAFTLNEIAIMDKENLKDTFTELLEYLDEQNIISRADITPEIIYIFTNNLMREAIYNTILLSEKKDLHLQIGLHYETSYYQVNDSKTELIANHFILAEHPAKASKFSILAANKNHALSNFEEASYYYQSALKFLTNAQQKLDVSLRLADTLLSHSEIDKALVVLGDLKSPTPKKEIYAKYIYLYTKAYYLKTDYPALIDVVNLHINMIPVGYYYYLTMITLADTLRITNKIPELLVHLDELRQNINSQFIKLGLSGFEYRKSNFSSLLTTLKQVSTKEKLQAPLYYICKLEGIYGKLEFDRSRFQQSAMHFRNVLAIAQFMDDNFSTYIALNSLGHILRKQGKLDTAFQYYNRAKAISEKSGDRLSYSKVIMDIGILHRQLLQHDLAIEAFKKSYSMTGLMGNKQQQGNAIYSLGELHYQLGQLDEAENCFNLALDLAGKIKDYVGISYINDALGDILTHKREFEKADVCYKNNLKLQRELQDTEGIAHTLGNLGNLARSRQDFSLALKYYRKNLALCIRIKDIDGEGRAYLNTGLTWLSLKDYPACQENLLLARACFEKAKIFIYNDLVNSKLQECIDKLNAEKT